MMNAPTTYGRDRRETSRSPLLAIAANTAWSILNFRRNLLLRLRSEGYRLVALVPEGEGVEELRALGMDVRFVPVDSRGASPGKDLLLLLRYWRLLRDLRPDAFIGYTIKPNVYGSLAASLHAIPVVNNVTGLGTPFLSRGALQWLVSKLYRTALRRSQIVFFLNGEDLKLFVSRGLVRPDQVALLPSEGIDLERFDPQPRPPSPELTFLLAARLIWEKGVGEYVAAAREVARLHRSVRFRLVGFVDESDTTAVPARQISAWQEEGLIDFGGAASDIRPHIAASDCVVLPTWYREGVPRILMEAAAMGKPIITTDSPGCRETVDDGQTGFLCTPRSVESLSKAMLRVAALTDAERQEMGQAGRAKMQRSFDERIVLDEYLCALERIFAHRGCAANRQPAAEEPMPASRSAVDGACPRK